MRALRHPRLYLAIGRGLITLILFLSLAPLPAPPLHVEQGDKIGHAIAYLVLTFWYAQLFDARRDLLLRAAAFVALGGLIEIAQSFTSYRSAEWLDFFADDAGVAAGLALGLSRAGGWLAHLERRVLR